jgi:hypothetical protein
VKRRLDTTLGLGIFAVLSAALLGLLAVFDGGRIGPEPPPPMPYPVIAAVTPLDARAFLAPRGGVIEESGRLTIREVSATEGTIGPLPASGLEPDERSRPAKPAPVGMLAGIRGFYRLGLLPPEELARPITITLERVYNEGRLMLVDGCFRFGGPKGPLAVFGPEARLGLVEGYLVVGQPGLPARFSARVGEVIGWEGKQVRDIAAAAKDKVRERCGAGEVISVLPWSASVQKAAAESWMATDIASKLKLNFAEALALLRRCGEPARRAIEGGPTSRSVEEACKLVNPQPMEPPPPPSSQRRR